MKDIFSSYSQIKYDQDGFSKQVANLTIGEIAKHRKIDSTVVVWHKEIKEGDTAISLSNDIYKSTEFYWVIMLVNDIVNPFSGWYLGSSALEAYVARKYNVPEDPRLAGWETREFRDALNRVHHFYDTEAERILDDLDFKNTLALYDVDPLSIGASIIPVTNYIHERDENENRRVLDIVSP